MATIAHVCKYLRTKSMYTADERGAEALVTPSETGVYWCNRTGGAMGPDQDIAGPRDCGEGRTCYLATPVLLGTTAG
ncbi:hypothetical protein HN371_12405 [Candidatus Poribacteria bacterium]|jgi:hypothetical protein|nr:hypothetical protein [Candidatus Poribacteria bacterium]MBT5532785.1 hypothetical protein [Candidatus Poribacteria bacterium]MBT5715041.1 hypothetical protein [Candidatus Poribacteria bacterium]MBT7100166.1 hypothetical protein [Candidatus Poribacteria bacterium]MBT7806002.1 hypothetical protein [Candidatus Poribacteria bacterium]